MASLEVGVSAVGQHMDGLHTISTGTYWSFSLTGEALRAGIVAEPLEAEMTGLPRMPIRRPRLMRLISLNAEKVNRGGILLGGIFKTGVSIRKSDRKSRIILMQTN